MGITDPQESTYSQESPYTVETATPDQVVDVIIEKLLLMLS